MTKKLHLPLQNGLLSLSIVFAILALGCGGNDADIGGPNAENSREADETLDEAIRELETIGYIGKSSPARKHTGVVQIDANSVYDAPSLVLSEHLAGAQLIDINGGLIHEWHYELKTAFPDYVPPERNAKFIRDCWVNAKLLDNGDIVAIIGFVGVVKVDKDSNLIWKHQGVMHHDLDIAPDGNIYVAMHKGRLIPTIHPIMPTLEEFVAVLGSGGDLIKNVSLTDAFANSDFAALVDKSNSSEPFGDLYHNNTVRIISPSARAKAEGFAPGRVVISLRHVNTIAVVDLESERVVWAESGPWIRQHNPHELANGNVLIFDNEGGDPRYGKSRVVEYNPTTSEIVWQYEGLETAKLYTESRGTAQRLPNANTLVVESNEGRVVEVTPEGKVVWEYITPFRKPGEKDRVAKLFSVTRLPDPALPHWIPSQETDKTAEPTPNLMHRIYSAELSLEADPTENEPSPAPPAVVGQLDTGGGGWIVYFDDLPGKDEKPKTKVRTVTGKIDVYEVYDWAEHHEELRGQTGHVWYRVAGEKGEWIYGSPGFSFYPAE